MKHILRLSIILSMILGSLGSTFAESEPVNATVDASYKTMTLDTSLDFEAKRDGYKVEMNWNPYTGEDFKYYKIMRSQTHSNPVYPDQHALQYSDDQEKDSYETKDWHKNGTYYRVCVITTQKDRHCSSVVKVDGFIAEKKEYSQEEKERYKTDDKEEKKQYYKSDEHKEKIKRAYQDKKSQLSTKMQQRAQALVSRFIKKVEAKYSTNEERIATIKKVMERLNQVAEKKPQVKTLIHYINSKFEMALEKYDGSIDEIEEILNEL